MTRKQMEQKIEELAAELAEMKKQGQNCCKSTCVHWHYSYPNFTTTSAALPWTYTYNAGALGATPYGQG